MAGDDSSTVPPAQYPANGSLVIYRPHGGETWIRGSSVPIRWYGGQSDWLITATLVPLAPSNLAVNYAAAEKILNVGQADLIIPTGLTKGDYYLKLECANCALNTFGSITYSFYSVSVKDN